jgi:arylsulfatase A
MSLFIQNLRLKIICLFALLSACHSNTKSSKEPKIPKPNIIFILADDLGYGDLGCYGQEKIQTPNLDKLASQGIKFTQHYAGSTVCAPSRCCLMTGYHTGHTVVRGNRPTEPEGQYPMPDSTVTVAELLKDAGYITGAMGKWGLGGPGSTGDPVNQGFDFFFGYNCQSKAHFYYPEYLWKNEEKILLSENKDGKKTTYSHDLIADEALRFIRNNQDKPFFLYIPFTIPHAELAVPENSLNQYKGHFEETPFPGGHYGAQEYPKAAYAGMVSRMDNDIGKILNLLDELKLSENTLVIFSSDNGPHHEGGNDPDFFNSNGLLRGIKRDLYEGGIRVPFIARWTGKTKPGTETGHISAFWDFLPTACDISGIKPPEDIDGISYLPALLGKNQEKHEFLYWEFHEQKGKQAVLNGNWKAIRLKIKENPKSPIELYNLSSDIGEENNIADKNPEIVKMMEKIMVKARFEDTAWVFIPSQLKQKL